VELGWGGYWAWDPVENSSFIPWLILTAYIHSVIIQERKNMLKIWNVSLIIFAFLATLFGTFLTRSGVFASVHSFSDSPLGFYFLMFMFLVL
ncbi:MAG TPA: cytochrome C biogenesis protein, partial [Flexistipes sinusarabici]|nr:cytochrome C biogenesis protein [Flexistipes sinusarabici]